MVSRPHDMTSAVKRSEASRLGSSKKEYGLPQSVQMEMNTSWQIYLIIGFYGEWILMVLINQLRALWELLISFTCLYVCKAKVWNIISKLKFAAFSFSKATTSGVSRPGLWILWPGSPWAQWGSATLRDQWVSLREHLEEIIAITIKHEGSCSVHVPSCSLKHVD